MTPRQHSSFTSTNTPVTHLYNMFLVCGIKDGLTAHPAQICTCYLSPPSLHSATIGANRAVHIREKFSRAACLLDNHDIWQFRLWCICQAVSIAIFQCSICGHCTGLVYSGLTLLTTVFLLLIITHVNGWKLNKKIRGCTLAHLHAVHGAGLPLWTQRLWLCPPSNLRVRLLSPVEWDDLLSNLGDLLSSGAWGTSERLWIRPAACSVAEFVSCGLSPLIVISTSWVTFSSAAHFTASRTWMIFTFSWLMQGSNWHQFQDLTAI